MHKFKELIGDGVGYWIWKEPVLNKVQFKNGEIRFHAYRTTEEQCSCLSFQKTGSPCKHMKMLAGKFEGTAKDCDVAPEVTRMWKVIRGKRIERESFDVDVSVVSMEISVDYKEWWGVLYIVKKLRSGSVLFILR